MAQSKFGDHARRGRGRKPRWPRHPAFPHDVWSVVFRRSLGNVCQFTFACDGALQCVRASEAYLARAVATAAGVVAPIQSGNLGGFVDPSKGGLQVRAAARCGHSGFLAAPAAHALIG